MVTHEIYPEMHAIPNFTELVDFRTLLAEIFKIDDEIQMSWLLLTLLHVTEIAEISQIDNETQIN